ncbi:MAG: hypothetical protein HY016_10865 [Nitrosomonadales bacterium]|nr:hypothetical protein [Nitrosomonadales bacterium]
MAMTDWHKSQFQKTGITAFFHACFLFPALPTIGSHPIRATARPIHNHTSSPTLLDNFTMVCKDDLTFCLHPGRMQWLTGHLSLANFQQEVVKMNTILLSRREEHELSGDTPFYTELGVLTAISFAIAAIVIM